MKKIALLIAASVVAASSNAAVYNVVAGTTIAAPLSINGIAAESSVSNALAPLFVGGLSVVGNLVTGPGFSIVSLTLTQVGTANVTNVGGNPALTMSLSGLSWSYSAAPINSSGFQGAGGELIQTAGTATCTGAAAGNVVCEGVANGIKGIDGFTNGAQRSNSALSFDGRKGDSSERIKLYDAIAEAQVNNTPAATAGMVFAGVGFGPGVDAIINYNLFGWGHGASSTANQFNSIYQSNVGLRVVEVVAPEVPVPAAAWLMGSGLVGLAGIARRRKMA